MVHAPGQAGVCLWFAPQCYQVGTGCSLLTVVTLRLCLTDCTQGLCRLEAVARPVQCELVMGLTTR